jgi:membrane-bound lytic murein transglycosylase D
VLTCSRRLLLPALVVLVACGRSPEPAPRPVVATSSGETADLPVIRQASAAARPTDAAAALADTDTTDTAATAVVTVADLDRRTADLFGNDLRVNAALPVPDDSTPGGGDSAPTWDIEVRSYETFDRVRFYVDRFRGPARRYIEERLSRGTRYEPMIRAKLRAGNLPEDMYYLALVESGFDSHAYSRAAAVGMWQFMTTTGRGMGLRVDWWVDERRDPVRSTEAAVRFLRGLNEQFGSLYLAAAAYNGGPGRIARGLNRYADDLEGASGDDMFFVLAEKKYLKNETKEYVPQLIAAALIAKEPARYGINIEQRPPFEYDSVRVGPAVPLAAIASASGATVGEIQGLNPHILRGMTPPRDSARVRIPAGSRERFDSAFAALPEEARVGATWVTSKKGATWSSLARGTKVSARAVSTWNPKVKANRKTGTIAAGTRILVPTPAVVSAGLSVPDPAVERYGGASRTHVVRKGDNLSKIAKRYGTTPAAIMRLNGLKKPLIMPGQELLVRGRR